MEKVSEKIAAGPRRRRMMAGASGFTIVELLVVMLITMFVLYAATQTLGSLVIQFKQQAKVTETNISSLLGLEILRRDLHAAGYGLPWGDASTSTTLAGFPYLEADPAVQFMYGGGGLLPFTPSQLNDAPNNAPRAVASGPLVGFIGPGPNGSDYLAIKSARAAINRAAGKFHMLYRDGTTSLYNTPADNLCPNAVPNNTCVAGASDWAIVISPDPTETSTSMTLVSAGTQFAPTLAGLNNPNITRLVYGIDSRGPTSTAPEPLTALRFPFNRADYYISYRNVPEKCAHNDNLNPGPDQAGWDPAHPPTDRTNLTNPGTGVLVKSVLDQTDGDFWFAGQDFTQAEELPIMECVADFKVIYGLDLSGNGTGAVASDYTNPPLTEGYDAATIRSNVREVRVYILRHEGAFDPKYLYDTDPTTPALDSNPVITVDERGDTLDLSLMDPRWQNFRWKIDRLVEKPVMLR